MALLNNWLEASSDSFKITVHLRRPVPVRTESIGAWLGCLRTLTWFGAIVNTVIVYLLGSARPVGSDTLIWALVLVSLASHGYLAMQRLMAVIVERVFWKRSTEEKEMVECERRVRDVCWKAVTGVAASDEEVREDKLSEFWSLDEGLGEIRRNLKDA